MIGALRAKPENPQLQGNQPRPKGVYGGWAAGYLVKGEEKTGKFCLHRDLYALTEGGGR